MTEIMTGCNVAEGEDARLGKRGEFSHKDEACMFVRVNFMICVFSQNLKKKMKCVPCFVFLSVAC